MAFKSVKRNRGAAGIDKVSIQMFESNLEQNLEALMRDLKRGLFEPKPLRRVFIPKGDGKFRPLGERTGERTGPGLSFCIFLKARLSVMQNERPCMINEKYLKG